MLTKICTKCGAKKSLGEFYKHKGGRYGVKVVCKVCSLLYDKNYRVVNPKKRKDYFKVYYKTNSQKIENHRKINLETMKAYQKEYRKVNAEKRKSYLKANAKKMAVIRKKYYEKCMMKVDFRLNGVISASIRHALKGNKNGRRWEFLAGYTLEKLKRHLEKQFTEGMTWENYGEWHIDHKVPINVFNFTKPEHEDFKKCWALSNLQPLWSVDNILKSNKLAKHFQPSLLF